MGKVDTPIEDVEGGRSPSGRATHERSQSSLSPPTVSVPNAGDIYQAGNALFRDLRCFLSLGGVDPGDCKLTITFPDHNARRSLAKRLQQDAAPAPPMSAAKLGNFEGTWQGVCYKLEAPQ